MIVEDDKYLQMSVLPTIPYQTPYSTIPPHKMCHTQIHRHVLCGCIYTTILLSQCHPPSSLLTNFLPSALKHQHTVTETPFEGLPCCEKCHELKAAELEARFNTIELKLRERCEKGEFSKGELAVLVKGNMNECKVQFDILCRPYRRTLRDAMVAGRKGFV